MAVTTTQVKTQKAAAPHGWQGFNTGLWQNEINVRDFIQQNYEPFDGDEHFLAGPTPRTKKIWETLKALTIEERRKGVLDVSQIPSSITAHPPGYMVVRAVPASGAEVRGIRVNEDVFYVHIRDAGGTLHTIDKAQLARLDRELDGTLMPSYESRLSAAEIDDVVAWLATLRGAK